MSNIWFKALTFAGISIMAIGGIYTVNRLDALEAKDKVIVRDLKIHVEYLRSLTGLIGCYHPDTTAADPNSQRLMYKNYPNVDPDTNGISAEDIEKVKAFVGSLISEWPSTRDWGRAGVWDDSAKEWKPLPRDIDPDSVPKGIYHDNQRWGSGIF